MRRFHILIAGSASLFAAGVLAAPPEGFSYGNYSVTTGAITAGDCPVSHTCTSLMTAAGVLQQQVTDNLTGGSYIHTIVVDSNADTGGVNAIVDGTYNLTWTNESFVGVSSTTAGDLAVDTRVALVPEGDQGPATVAGNQFNHATIAQGNLTEDGAGIVILQRQHVGVAANTGTTDFYLLHNGSESDRYMRLDQQVLANNVAGLTVRRSSGSFTGDAGTLILPDGQFLDYNAGDDIGTVWLQLLQFAGAGAPALGAGLRQFQMQSFNVNDEKIEWNTCAAGFQGQCVGVDFGGLTWTYWDDHFGTAPVTPLAGGSFTNPPGAFPNFPD